MIWILLAVLFGTLVIAGGLAHLARPLLPRRSDPDLKMITDLDRLISEPVGFRWRGKIHKIKPMTNETFLKVLNELAKMDALYRAGTKNHEEVMIVYARLFGSVCDTITLKDVKQMSYAQVINLYREIMSCVSGKAYFEGEEKKTPKKE